MFSYCTFQLYLEAIVIGTQSIQVRVNLKLSQQLEAGCHNGIRVNLSFTKVFCKCSSWFSDLVESSGKSYWEVGRDFFHLLSQVFFT